MADRATLQTIPDMVQSSDLEMDHQDVYFYEDNQKKISGLPDTSTTTDFPTYLDLNAHSPTIKQEYVEDFSLMSWTQKHPEHWTSTEVLDWIYFLAYRKNTDMDCAKLRGEAFRDVTGHQLSMMSQQDYINLDPVNGSYLCEMYSAMYKDASFIEPVFESPEQFNSYNTETILPETSGHHEHIQHESLLDAIQINEQETQVRLGSHWYPIDVEQNIGIDDWFFKPDPDILIYGSSESDTASEVTNDDIDSNQRMIDGLVQRLDSTGSDVFSDEESMYPSKKPQVQKKKPKKNKASSAVSKGNHLWEFIRDLLKDPQYNPGLLRWEEKDTGVFRFVQSEAVARMWGRKKNNTGMTYEKLSRAMRFCRTAGYFAEVPKTGKFPKKLCFRFGPKAFGWGEKL